MEKKLTLEEQKQIVLSLASVGSFDFIFHYLNICNYKLTIFIAKLFTAHKKHNDLIKLLKNKYPNEVIHDKKENVFHAHRLCCLFYLENKQFDFLSELLDTDPNKKELYCLVSKYADWEALLEYSEKLFLDLAFCCKRYDVVARHNLWGKLSFYYRYNIVEKHKDQLKKLFLDYDQFDMMYSLNWEKEIPLQKRVKLRDINALIEVKDWDVLLKMNRPDLIYQHGGPDVAAEFSLWELLLRRHEYNTLIKYEKFDVLKEYGDFSYICKSQKGQEYLAERGLWNALIVNGCAKTLKKYGKCPFSLRIKSWFV